MQSFLARSSFAFVIAFAFLASVASAQTPSIDTALASQYFREAETACLKDNGRLWGKSLCGPMIFADPRTRIVVANQPDAEGLLTKKDDVYVGRLPDKETIANYAVKWAGVKWTMVMWPLPKDEFLRAKLMMHESYHRIRSDIGLPAGNPTNDHLDSLEGRLWLQLEWRALRQALISTGASRKRAIEDALAFRNYRRSVFQGAESSERELEMNEGLSEYTGARMTTESDKALIEHLAKYIEQAPARPTFVRSFAYVSGPAYGALLDASGNDWRKGLKPQNDLGLLLQKAHSIKLPKDLKARAEKRAASYDGEKLKIAETERDNARRKRIAENRARFVEGPTLTLPFTDKMQFSFDPNNLVPLEGAGTVYPTLRVSDEWGILEVTNGALLIREGGMPVKAVVEVPKDLNQRPLKGEGWSLDLREGWSLAPGARQGDMILKRAE